MKTFFLLNYVLYFYVIVLCLLLFVLSNSSHSWEWVVCEFYDTTICLKFNINFDNTLFLLTVSVIFSSVYQYSFSYMNKDVFLKRFFMTIISFIIFMVILICSGNTFTTLIGWDGLGVTSMILIMYYCSNSSLKASMYTFIINRLGDCFFLILIFFFFCKFPSLNFTFFSLGKEEMDLIPCFMLMLLSMTKSAQVPFSSWLTKAMEAPTPVSSLVHSSTLVTAGIYVLFVYQEMWSSSVFCCYMLLIISLSTMFIASIAGMMEMDLKKIIAYSTLSQLGFIMFSFSLSLFSQGFFHLIIHAFFKALMFMGVGYIIHHSSGWQDIRFMTMNYSCSPNVVKMLVMAVMSLCGMPFMSGFFSKDYILDSFMKENMCLPLLVMVVLSLMLTMFYSFRLCWFLMSGLKSTFFISDDNCSMLKSMIVLSFSSSCMGSILMWMKMPFMPAHNFPKVILFLFLIFMLSFFWSFNKWMTVSFFYLKTNFYLYILVNLTIFYFMKNMNKLMWHSDLVSMIGKMIKQPSIIIQKLWNYSNFKVFTQNFKEFFLFTIMFLILFTNN